MGEDDTDGEKGRRKKEVEGSPGRRERAKGKNGGDGNRGKEFGE
jgi:hypothetical protein